MIGPTSDNRAVFDSAALLELAMYDKELARKLVSLFLKNAPSRINALKESIAARDAVSAGELAHSLKGMAANTCAEALLRLSSAMEQAGMEGDMEKLERMLPDMERALSMFKRAVREDSCFENCDGCI